MDHTENLPLGRWGRSVLCRDDTPGALLARVVISCGSNASWLGEKTQKKEEALTAHMSLCQIWPHASSKRRTARSMVRICQHRPTLVPSRAPVEFRERTSGAPSRTLSSKGRSSRRLLEDLKKDSRLSTVWYGWEC